MVRQRLDLAASGCGIDRHERVEPMRNVLAFCNNPLQVREQLRRPEMSLLPAVESIRCRQRAASIHSRQGHLQGAFDRMGPSDTFDRP